jgi:hypothetical protein
MGADFDGDTVAVFALPALSGDPATACPSALARHDIFDAPMFLPGKQYVWGLHCLERDETLRTRLNEALRAVGAPSWPAPSSERSTKQRLESWTKEAAEHPTRTGRWWGVVEEHALAALARCPGMGLGLFDPEELRMLDVIVQGAAKGDHYRPANEAALTRILNGRSLDAYKKGTAQEDADPIGVVMAAAKASVGSFGGVFRRLLFGADAIDNLMIREGQALTEQLTQQVLSIKAGQRPLEFGVFRPRLQRLLQGQPTTLPESLAHLRPLWIRLQERQRRWKEAAPLWLGWLRQPHRLAELVDRSPRGVLRLPIDDPRTVLFMWTG